jgi:hypothetical protein
LLRFDPENASWTLFVILKIVPETGYDTFTERKSTNRREEKTKMSGREEKMDRNSDAASGTVFRNSTCFQRNKQKLYIYIFLYKKVLIIVQNENLQNETHWGAVRVKET